MSLNRAHNFLLFQAERTWRRECEGGIDHNNSAYNDQIHRAFDAGAVQGVLSTDTVETLLSVARWKALVYDLKAAALKQRDEWKALVAIRLELGLAHCEPDVARRYLHLSAREIIQLDKLVTAYIERPLRFCNANYRQPFKPRGSTRRRPKEGWASDVLRRRIHCIGALETKLTPSLSMA